MSKIIHRDHVRRGDRVRIFVEGTVTTARDDDNDLRLDDKLWIFEGAFEDEGYQIELLDRPIELPTKVGSIVEVKGSFNSANWMLTDKGGWVSDRNVFKGADEFKGFLKHYEWKVIL